MFHKKHEFQNMQSISVINLIKGDFWVDLCVFICKDKDAQISRLSQARQMSLLQETSCREFWLNTVLGDHTPLHFPCIGLWFLNSLLSLLRWHRPGRCSVRQERLICSHRLRLYQSIMVGLWHQELGVAGHFAHRKKQRDACWCSGCLLLFILPGIPGHGTVLPTFLSGSLKL